MQNRREVVASSLAGLAAGGAPGALLQPAQAPAAPAPDSGHRRHTLRTA
ncbi:hypothetical protein JYK14_22125 [Siccirubricoccus sp. KC 17139]|uniref:Twin-arginine translocation signal domain-containing protein n=1 Tax=Siccirubricoccus soli TaxID=2899147 RepID=A0ABT1DA75_9PROT|nr:hypothetical protein [Siccirubricoccus soli]MCO6418836.1 hypothetical protein [Siccirubricoccus soli]MCP2684971.1 hypothetical protein [Siccirubricoccus soli]